MIVEQLELFDDRTEMEYWKQKLKELAENQEKCRKSMFWQTTTMKGRVDDISERLSILEAFICRGN